MTTKALSSCFSQTAGMQQMMHTNVMQPNLARDAHECGKTILTRVCMSSTRWWNYSFLQWHVPVIFFFFAHHPVLFVVPVLIRLMENRAAASVPLTPHPPCLLGLRGLGHKATGGGVGGREREVGGYEGSASGVPSFLCLSGAQNFHDTGEHWHHHALLVIWSRWQTLENHCCNQNKWNTNRFVETGAGGEVALLKIRE